jgi:hypothetical protein
MLNLLDKLKKMKMTTLFNTRTHWPETSHEKPFSSNRAMPQNRSNGIVPQGL